MLGWGTPLRRARSRWVRPASRRASRSRAALRIGDDDSGFAINACTVVSVASGTGRCLPAWRAIEGAGGRRTMGGATAMPYALGIDLGTTFTAAAVAEAGAASTFQLGARTAAIPSVIAVRDGGSLLVGEAAERRALTDPTCIAREFKRRLGDPTPLTLAGIPYSVVSLTAVLVRHVVQHVTSERGGAPAAVVVTHPATYGPYKIDQLRTALNEADVTNATLVAEPVAAAAYYAHQERVPDRAVIAVYDLGGGTFDAAVVERAVNGFHILGMPQGLDSFGGVDIDQAVVGFVDRTLDGAVSALDPDDPAAVAAVGLLRTECRDAKEALSEDTDTQIAVALPTTRTEVRLTRVELEQLIRPRLRDTTAMLDRAVTSAGVAWPGVARVLLVGGSSRIPLVAQLITQETGRPVAVDANPKHSIALGGALLGLERLPTPAPPPTPPAVVQPDPAPAPLPPSPPPQGSRVPVVPLVIGGVVMVAIVAIAALALTRGSGRQTPVAVTQSSPTTTPATASSAATVSPRSTVTTSVASHAVVPASATASSTLAPQTTRCTGDLSTYGATNAIDG